MVLRRFALALASAFAACLIAAHRFAEAVVDTFRFVIDAVANPSTPAFAIEGWSDISPGGPGQSLDRALQQDLRHEAGVSRRSAARHI